MFVPTTLIVTPASDITSQRLKQLLPGLGPPRCFTPSLYTSVRDLPQHPQNPASDEAYCFIRSTAYAGG